MSEGNLARLFKCSACGSGLFEEVMENVTVLSNVDFVDDQGFVDYGEQTNEDGDVSHFQCSACGMAIRDADGEYAKDGDLAEALTEMGVKWPWPLPVDPEPARRARLAAALETPGDLTPEELEQAKAEIIEILLGDDNAVD